MPTKLTVILIQQSAIQIDIKPAGEIRIHTLLLNMEDIGFVIETDQLARSEESYNVATMRRFSSLLLNLFKIRK